LRPLYKQQHLRNPRPPQPVARDAAPAHVVVGAVDDDKGVAAKLDAAAGLQRFARDVDGALPMAAPIGGPDARVDDDQALFRGAGDQRRLENLWDVLAVADRGARRSGRRPGRRRSGRTRTGTRPWLRLAGHLFGPADDTIPVLD
jgi:hypothetical protein